MKKQLCLYLLLSLLMSSSLYPLTKTDRRILTAAKVTGTLIGAALGWVGGKKMGPSLLRNQNIDFTRQKSLQSLVINPVSVYLGGAVGYKLSGKTSKEYFKRKYGVSSRVLDIALQYNYDLSTDQKLILQAAEQKNNDILKKYLVDLFEQQFGKQETQKVMREFFAASIYKEPARRYQSLLEKIGEKDVIRLTTMIQVGIKPIAILYFDRDKATPSYNATVIESILEALGTLYQFNALMILAKDLMKAVGLESK